MNSRSIYFAKDFIKFKKLWNSGIEKQLFRCSKEYGVYNKIKNTLNPKSKADREDCLYSIYKHLTTELILNKNMLIDFRVRDKVLIERKYGVSAALEDSRHLAQLMVFTILQKSLSDEKKFKDIFKAMDKEIFGKHRIKTYFVEKWSIIKLVFK